MIANFLLASIIWSHDFSMGTDLPKPYLNIEAVCFLQDMILGKRSGFLPGAIGFYIGITRVIWELTAVWIVQWCLLYHSKLPLIRSVGFCVNSR